MNVLILAAGDSRADQPGSHYPIWLSEVGGSTLLERQMSKLMAQPADKVVFAFRQFDIDHYHVDSIARQISPGAAILAIKRETAGAACTTLLAADELDLEDELVVASATDHLDADFPILLDAFRSQEADAGVLTFDSLHPRYSFLRVDDAGWVTEAAEKNPISRRANAGLYWFRRGSALMGAIQRMILKDAHVNGVFYLSPALNELVLQGARIAAQPILEGQYTPLKDQRQFALYEHQLEQRKRNAS